MFKRSVILILYQLFVLSAAWCTSVGVV